MIAEINVAESLRCIRLVVLNAVPGDRAALEQRHGQVWDPVALARDFVVLGYQAPIVVARRKSDGVLGSLEFQHHPRFYFNWQEDMPNETHSNRDPGAPASQGSKTHG